MELKSGRRIRHRQETFAFRELVGEGDSLIERLLSEGLVYVLPYPGNWKMAAFFILWESPLGCPEE